MLVPIAQRTLGLHEPADSEFVLLPVPAPLGCAETLMAKPQARIAAVQFGFALGILAILARAAQLQLIQGERWAEQAQRQRTERAVLPARRGALCTTGMACPWPSVRSFTTSAWRRTS